MSAAAAAPMARKRPAPDQEPRAADSNKRPRYKDLRSIDEFDVFEVLGEGAEGVVSRARDRRSGKEVALKWIRGDGPDGHGPPDRRALAMEAGCLHACRGHPSIIGIDGVAVDPKTGDVHLVLELIQGGLSLHDSIWRTKSEDEIRGMMRQLIGAAKKGWQGSIVADFRCPSQANRFNISRISQAWNDTQRCADAAGTFARCLMETRVAAKNWSRSLLRTSMSAVLVNGVPGPWITCKQGLRQGDPISPYLFLLVADVLQALINHDGSISHPLALDRSCPILQYADDTLLLIPAELGAVQTLKSLLDQFSAATGLKISYHKSTLVPMHSSEAKYSQFKAVLQCKVDSFPQVYLGLPHSDVKLNLSALTPLIARADKQLAGWQVMFLNPKGRQVLVSCELSCGQCHLLPHGCYASCRNY